MFLKNTNKFKILLNQTKNIKINPKNVYNFNFFIRKDYFKSNKKLFSTNEDFKKTNINDEKKLTFREKIEHYNEMKKATTKKFGDEISKVEKVVIYTFILILY